MLEPHKKYNSDKIPYNCLGASIDGYINTATELPYSFTASHSGMMLVSIRKGQSQTYGQVNITCSNIPTLSYSIILPYGGVGYAIESRLLPVNKGYTYTLTAHEESTSVVIRLLYVYY